jgi:transcriptional regulator with XRE-family HTH domain
MWSIVKTSGAGSAGPAPPDRQQGETAMSSNLHDDLPSLAIGQRIQIHRERSGKTRDVLGGLVGKSAEWVKAIEKGRLLPPRLPMLERIATVLRIPLSDLVGEESPQIRTLAGPAHHALADVRSAINAPPRPGDLPDLGELRLRVTSAWKARHASGSHRTTLGELLPGLIRDTRTASSNHEGAARRSAYALESDVLGLAQMYVAFQPATELLWRVAERATIAAQESGDAHSRAVAAWFMVEALREGGDWDSAMDINLSAIDDAERHINGDHDLIAMVGALHTVAALTAARAGEDGRAWRHHDTAAQVMRRLPAAHVHPRTWFSPAVVGFYALSLSVELRRGPEAVRTAERIDPASITSRPRRARHLVEVARAHHLRADADATLQAITQAVQAAPETVRYNSHARGIVVALRDDAAKRSAAGQLAAQIGL